MDPKKQEERGILARFLKLSRLTKGYKSDRNRMGESPDFLCVNGEKTIGIEVTKIVNMPGADRISPLAKEDLHWETVQMAKKLYGDSESVVDVSVSFFDLGKVDRVTKGEIAKSISDFVRRNIFSDLFRIYPEDDYVAELPQGVSSIIIVRDEGIASGFWSVSGARFVPTLEATQLQAEIDRKNRLLPKYRKADKQILLLTVDIGALPYHFARIEEVIAHSYKSSFDEVYLFSFSQMKYWPLKLQR